MGKGGWGGDEEGGSGGGVRRWGRGFLFLGLGEGKGGRVRF